MKKLIIIYFILTLVVFKGFLFANENAFSLTKEEQTYLKQNPIIKYTPDPNWLPFEAFDNDGDHVGIMSDMLKLIESQLNVKFEIVANKSWTEALALANENKIDMITSDPNDVSLQNKLQAISSNLTNPIVIIMKKGNSYISDLDYIKEKKIVLIKGYGYVPELIKAYPNIKFKYVNNLKAALLSISDGENDVLLASVASTTYNISKLGLSNLAVVGRTKVDMKITFFIQKEKEVLFNIMNRLLSTQFKDSNLVNEIMKKWTFQEYVEKIDYKLIFKIVAFFIFISLVGFIWNRQLASSHKKIEDLNLKLEEKVNELKYLSITDGMTGLHNRRYLDEIFEQELQRCKRSKRTFIFSLFDVDKFKQYNDTYGHASGDEALISIAQNMKDISQRANDFTFRAGGEEFCFITSEMNENDAYLYTDTLRQSIEDNLIEHKLNPASKYLTASFGLVVVKFEKDIKITYLEIYKIADDALYEAKNSGRNKIVKVIIR